MQRIHELLHQVAICWLLLAVGAVLLLTGHVRLAAWCSLFVGIGGLGAAWSAWTADNGGWLDIAAAFKRWPRHSVARCALEHGGFIPLGAVLLVVKR